MVSRSYTNAAAAFAQTSDPHLQSCNQINCKTMTTNQIKLIAIFATH